MEKVLLPAYRMNSRVCDYVKMYPEGLEEVLRLYLSYENDCSEAKKKLDDGINALYKTRPGSEGK